MIASRGKFEICKHIRRQLLTIGIPYSINPEGGGSKRNILHTTYYDGDHIKIKFILSKQSTIGGREERYIVDVRVNLRLLPLLFKGLPSMQ